jgi:hypothetical protein
VGFCSCFSLFATKFPTSSLFLYGCHIIVQQDQNHTLMLVTLQNITQAVLNELLCVGYSHNSQPFCSCPHVHNWWSSTWSFWKFLIKPYMWVM